MLRVTRRRVYLLARAGRLRSVRIGERSVRFRREDLDRFMEGR